MSITLILIWLLCLAAGTLSLYDFVGSFFKASMQFLHFSHLLAGYLDAESVTCFDPQPFGMGQSEADILDPQQRLCVRSSLEAMEDAGLSKAKGAAIGVYVGVTTVDFADIVIKTAGPPFAYTGPALTTAICSNRVAQMQSEGFFFTVFVCFCMVLVCFGHA